MGLLRHYSVSIQALFRLYSGSMDGGRTLECSIKALLRLYQGAIKALLRVYGCWQDARVIGASYLDSACTRGTRHLSLCFPLSLPLFLCLRLLLIFLSILMHSFLFLSPSLSRSLPLSLSLSLALALSLSCSTLLSYCLLKSTCLICRSTVVFFKNILFLRPCLPSWSLAAKEVWFFFLKKHIFRLRLTCWWRNCRRTLKLMLMRQSLSSACTQRYE
jgi:hypothetical protein